MTPYFLGHAWCRAVVHCYWGCATGCACIDSIFPHVPFGHHALGDSSTSLLILAWHGNLLFPFLGYRGDIHLLFFFFFFISLRS